MEFVIVTVQVVPLPNEITGMLGEYCDRPDTEPHEVVPKPEYDDRVLGAVPHAAHQGAVKPICSIRKLGVVSRLAQSFGGRRARSAA